MKLSSPMHSAFWLFIEKLVVLALSFAVTIAVARHLMPGSFGKLSFFLALVSLAAPFMSLGLNSLVSREIIQRPNDLHYIVGTAMALRWLAGLLVSAVGSFFAYVTLPLDEAIFLALMLFASATNAGLIVDFWLQALVANRYAILSRFSVVLIFSLARLVAIKFDAPLSVFIYLFAAEFIVLNLMFLFVYHFFSGGISHLRFSLGESRTLLKNSCWLLFSGIAAILYLKIDQVMLGFLTSDSTVGVYAIAVKFSEVGYFIPIAIVTSYFPQLIDKREKQRSGYTSDIQKLNDVLLSLAVVFVIVIWISADSLIPWLFGDPYIEVVPILLVHIWAAIFVFMRTLLSKWLISENLFRLSFLSQAAGAIFNVILNLYLIPTHGALGAAYATLASHAVAGYLVLFLHSDLRPMATVVGKSLLLPLRLLRHGRRIYDVHAP